MTRRLYEIFLKGKQSVLKEFHMNSPTLDYDNYKWENSFCKNVIWEKKRRSHTTISSFVDDHVRSRWLENVLVMFSFVSLLPFYTDTTEDLGNFLKVPGGYQMWTNLKIELCKIPIP